MSGPFDSEELSEADAADSADEDLGAAAFDEGGGDDFGEGLDAGDTADAAQDLGDAADASALGEDYGDDADDMAVWNAFEEEIADGLDAADDDEFLGRLLGGLGRAAGVIGRGLGGAAGAAGRVAGQVGRVAGAVSPAASAAARLARMLGATNVAGALGQVGRAARGVGQVAGGAQGLFGQLSQLLGQGGNEFDAFDAMADLYLEDGVDEALPAAVALAARAAARGLGFRNIAQLSLAGRRALVRGIGAAARELMRSRSPQAVRALPRLAQSAARVAQRRTPTPQRAVQAMRRGLPQAARRVAQNPRVARRLAQAPARRAARPLARPTDLGFGVRTSRAGARTYHLSGPVTLTITPQ